MTVMMCLYQCMSMDVTYNFRQPMNLGDVLLAVDRVNVEGESLKDIKCLILYKHQQLVQLTFLNENWFNKFDWCSVRVADDTRKNRYVENGIVDLHCYIHDILCKS